MSGTGSSDATPVAGVGDLVAYLASGEKPPEQYRVGTEHEKIGLYEEDLRPVPFEGPRGIEALLAGLAEGGGFERVSEHGNLIALTREGASITLEPGGQLELSGAPLRTIHETCSEFNAHLALVREVSAPLGIVWLSLGINPLHGIEEVPRMPKDRYAIMRSYLPTRGELAMDMMHLTATVQANFDYSDEADMAAKLRVATGASSIVSALFANSSIAAGKPSGFASKRVHIWRYTDPDRCGILPFVFEPGFGYQRYTDWALDVPMFFIVRGDRYLPAAGVSFRRFLAEGLDGERATLGDWDRHLTTLFPEVRLKRIIEVRGTDAVPPDLICALPALWKGILYDDGALEAAWELVRDQSLGERVAALEEVARRGLGARIAGRPVIDLARELVAISSEGLRRIGHAGVIDPDERGFLEPLHAQLATGKSPGQLALDRWEGDWERSARRLIEYARY